MLKKSHGILSIVLIAALAIGLCGCDGQIDENILNTEADYSVNIALPYATVTPPPAQKEQAAALVIDTKGAVTVNDSASVLDDEISHSSGDSNYKSLRLGNTGLAVQALQTRLQELGYFSEGVSGIFDEQTESAVRRFEQTYGTMQTGVATSYMQEKLFSSDALVYASDAYNEAVVAQYTILQRGDVGSPVYALQQRLKNLGYPIDELTGIFDNETANAVMLFYEAYGLTASEVANVALQKEIYSDSAKVYRGASSAASASDSLNIMEEDSVAQIQQRLIDLGYLSGEANGILDSRTQIAVKLFEEACGQLPSGAISDDIQTILASDNAPAFENLSAGYSNLLEGSGGEAVSRLQARLVALGFATGSPNGEYGSATTASVKLFQAANGLEETGVATVYVQTVLYSSFALNINGETAISALPASTVEPEVIETVDVNVQENLSPGNTGDSVLKLQTRLTELGFVSSMTGSYDSLTSRAVSAFQTIVGCQPTGEADQPLLDFIYSNAAPNSSQIFHTSVQPYRSLASGDSGDDITNLQKRLWEMGYLEKQSIKNYVGVYNDATESAIAQLQTDLGYENPNGVASAELQCYLYSEYCTLKKGE